MTLGRFILILIFICATFVTANLVIHYLNQQNVYRLATDDTGCPSCNLNKAELMGWDLNGFDFTQASMVGADLRCADLRNAILAGANLKAANMTGAQLEGADLLFANMDSVIWEDGTNCEDIIPTIINIEPDTNTDLVN